MISDALEILLMVALAPILLGPWALAVWALARTSHIRELTRRVAGLEERLSRSVSLPESPLIESPAPALGASESLARTRDLPELGRRVAELEERLSRSTPATSQIPPVETRPLPTSVGSPRHPASPSPTLIDWESMIGRKALGWGAVVLVVFGGGFFVKYAIENQWIGPLGRVALAAMSGIALVLFGQGARRRGWFVYFQMLTSAGVILCYIAAYGSFGFYHLLPRGSASAFMVLIIVESAVVAVLANAPALGMMAILGGLVTPLLLASEKDDYISFFLYLIALDVGAALMVMLKRWPGVGSVALLGTQALFWSWYATNFHPEKRSWALGFQVAVYVLFLAQALVARAPRRREAGWEDLSRWLLNAALGFAAFYTLLEPDYEPWLGTLAVAMAALYAGFARWMQSAWSDENNLFLMTLSIAVGFVAAAFPIQANAPWVALGWAAEASALWWFGVRVRTPLLRVIAVALLTLAVGRVLFVDESYTIRAPYWPIVNDHALPALGVAACWLGALASTRTRVAKLAEPERDLAASAEVGGVLLVWFILSVDLFGAFQARQALSPPGDQRWLNLGQMALSMLWAFYAGAVLAVGFILRSARLRWTALALFGMVVFKVFVFDMSDLDQIYRIVAFLAGAVVLGIAAGIYQRLRPDPAEVKRGEAEANAAS